MDIKEVIEVFDFQGKCPFENKIKLKTEKDYKIFEYGKCRGRKELIREIGVYIHEVD